MIASRALIGALDSDSRAARAASRAVKTASMAALNAVHSAFSSRRGRGRPLAWACHCACSARALSIASRASGVASARLFAAAMRRSRSAVASR